MIALFILGGNSPSAFAVQSGTTQSQKDPSKKDELKKDITKWEDALKRNPKSLRARETLAELYFSAKNYPKTIELLNPFNEQVTTEARFTLAAAYHQTQRYADEVRILEFVVSQDENNAEAYYALGHAKLKTGQETEAVTSFRRTIAINPQFRLAYDELLRIFFARGNRYEERELVSEMIRRFGEQKDFYNRLCRLNSLDGYNKQAHRDCETAKKRSPASYENYIYLARSFENSEDDKRANDSYIEAARKFPSSDETQRAAGQFFLKAENFPVAERYFQQAFHLNAKDPQNAIGLAEAQFGNGKYDEAYKAYFSACILDKNLSERFQDATSRLRQKGKDSEARRYSQGTFACQQK